MDQTQTLGQQRVRVNFNPSQDHTVDVIKQMTAELIDLCEQLKAKDARLAALAQTHYEDAAMWAVKAATTTETKAEAEADRVHRLVG
jgi:hypothetical protein